MTATASGSLSGSAGLGRHATFKFLSSYSYHFAVSPHMRETLYSACQQKYFDGNSAMPVDASVWIVVAVQRMSVPPTEACARSSGCATGCGSLIARHCLHECLSERYKGCTNNLNVKQSSSLSVPSQQSQQCQPMQSSRNCSEKTSNASRSYPSRSGKRSVKHCQHLLISSSM